MCSGVCFVLASRANPSIYPEINKCAGFWSPIKMQQYNIGNLVGLVRIEGRFIGREIRVHGGPCRRLLTRLGSVRRA